MIIAIPLCQGILRYLSSAVGWPTGDLFRWIFGIPRQRKRAALMDKDNTINFSFLADARTINHIKKRKVMIILRGLSGSGKSTICKAILSVYPNAVHCSADHYFEKDGEYKFDAKKLSYAHTECQQKAAEACAKGASVVIIDNTNVRRWEMRCYKELARQEGYVVLVAIPKTPWCFNAVELALKNSHGVGIDVIRAKLEQFEESIPIYYGWMLLEEDSDDLRWRGDAYRQQCLEALQIHGTNITGAAEGDDMTNYYQLPNNRGFLHVTAMFCRHGREPGSKQYHRCQDVRDACGKVYSMKVIGFVITPRTLGARVRLDSASLSLWGQDDKEGIAGTSTNATEISTGDVSHQMPDVNGDVSENVSSRDIRGKWSSNITITRGDSGVIDRSSFDEGWEAEASQSNLSFLESNTTGTLRETSELDLREYEILHNTSRFYPTAGVGSRAHVTLGCAAGFKPVQTGLDLIDVIKRERKAQSNTDITYQLDGAVMRYYSDGCCVVYLDKEIDCEAMFAGFY